MNWSLEEEIEGIHAFRVLRGATPQTTGVVATVSSDDLTFTDVSAVWSGEAFWYRVIALDHEGVVMAESMSVLVQLSS